MQNETQKEIAGIQSATSRQNTKDQAYAQNEMLAYQQKESTARVASIMENTNLSKQQQVSEIMRQMLTQAQTAENAMRQAHADGWFIVFDTLTLADDRLEAFYDNPNALRDYFRDIGRMVLAAEGRKANDSHADCYQYFCVPEYGTANGRLHFH